ncbi:MAG: DNA mismatch repair protein MutS2 [Marinoscillum sp.]|jgi:DNA mismatch repair protein MutS2
MLIYPQDIREKLGVDQLVSLIREQCKSQGGAALADKIGPSANLTEITKRLEQTDEMLKVLQNGGQIPSRDFQDLKHFLVKIRVQGTFLQADEFGLLKSLLQLLYDWINFLKGKEEDYPNLVGLAKGFEIDPTLIRSIDKIVDERGEVRDNASPELASIRSLLIQKERAVRVAINKVLRHSIQQKFTDEESAITIRDGRLVIPVKAEFKRRIQGFVHDESATGQTVFLEPTEALELNNEVRELQYREKREIAKILTKLTDLIRSALDDLDRGAVFISIIDFVHAKAVFARNIEAVKPDISKQPLQKWYVARHPLLWLAHKATGKPTIPLSIELNRQEQRILIISGPNAGGKSVALKTVGILQYMFQCGLLVPVGEGSTFGIFKSIFLDIGDTQSLENDLSTYSSHLTSMNYFLQMADRDSLFLIDEFGTGTEPQFGGAIAESILSTLNETKAFGVVTTHYHNLKKFGENHEGVVNGAMKYDVAALEPLFILEVGKPGSSFAFEIATKIGLPSVTIEQARGMVGTSQVAYDALLNSLEVEKSKYDKLLKKLEKESKEITVLKSDYESLKEMLQTEQKQVLKQAKLRASQIIDEANRRIEHTIREIKENNADKEKTKQLRDGLKGFQTAQTKDIEKTAPVKKKPLLSVGDYVKLDDQDNTGEIMDLKGKQAQVRFGNLISFIDMKRLHKVSGGHSDSPGSKPKKVGGINMLEKRTRFSSELDIRGTRADEALSRVDEFLDEALLLGSNQIRIIHGKGHGILREVIRGHLKGYSAIDKVYDEHVEFGGSGITVIDFK